MDNSAERITEKDGKYDAYAIHSLCYVGQDETCKMPHCSGCPIRKLYQVVQAIENLPEPENKPLTLEQLRERVGKPVWVETGEVSIGEQIVGCWQILHSVSELFVVFMGGGNGLRIANYGKTWLAYDHPPKEE